MAVGLRWWAVNVIGFDDGPFERGHRGDVLLVGVVCSGTRIDGIVSGKIRRDGANAMRVMVDLVRASQFGSHLQAVMLQGIAVGGFNVVDVHGLRAALRIPVLVVTRRPPDMAAVKRALFAGAPAARPPVSGAARKWRLIEQAGTMELLGPSRRSQRRDRAQATESAKTPSGIRTNEPRLWIQRAGLSLDQARKLVADTTLHGNIPEPLRVAHLIAGGITTGKSRGRA
jgi:endonuclease V-like protein UPF0215 family